MTDRVPEPVRGEVATPGHFARRTIQLARQPQPVARWQRAIWGQPYVHPDGTIAAATRGDAAEWRQELLDASSGGAVPGPWASPKRFVLAEAANSRAYSALTVTATHLYNATVGVEAVDYRSGRTAWRHAPVPRATFDAGPWSAWLNCEHPDADLLIPHGRGASRRLTLLDPLTGQVRWDVSWSDSARRSMTGNVRPPADGGERVRLAPIYLDSALPGEPPVGLAGVDEADGTPLWHIDGPWMTGLHWKHPAYLGSSGRYLIIVGVPGLKDDPGRPAPAVAGPCSCQDRDEVSVAARAVCSTCGGVRHAYITIAVHDRLTGRPIWDARWPDRTAPHTQAAGLADIRGNVVLTREGGFLRARRIEDGRLLWATIPPPRYGLVRQDSARARDWAWLRHADRGRSPGAPEGGDLFIHAPTGQQLTISDAFHQTRDGLVLTCAENMLTCLELPPQPEPPRQSAASRTLS